MTGLINRYWLTAILVDEIRELKKDWHFIPLNL